MNNYRLIVVVFLVFSFDAFANLNYQLKDYEKEMQKSVPALQELSQAYPEDMGILTGIVNLTRSHHLPVPEGFSIGEQLEAMLAVDPGNRFANALSAWMLTNQYIGKMNLLASLESLIDNTEQRGLDKLRLRNKKEFRGYLNDHVEEIRPARGSRMRFAPYFVIDFDVARKVLNEKLLAKAPPVLKKLDQKQAKDPDNAIYDYLKARIYYEMGDVEAVLTAMEKGAKKKYREQYIHQAEKAEQRVLEEIDFPQEMRIKVSGLRIQFGDVIVDIWQDDPHSLKLKGGIGSIAAEFATQGDLKKAEKIYDMFTKAFEQGAPERYVSRELFMKSIKSKIDKYRVAVPAKKKAN